MKVFDGTITNTDDSLLVDISDALSERDRVRFTVHTRTTLPHFAKPVLSVVRQHEEFIWLHDCIEDNDQYAGYIIPPPPPKPDFDASREKLQRLGDGEASMTKEEFAKMKQELEAEYLAIFKKTVAMHEIFLQRLAAHEKFRDDNNFKIFLEYENELAVRSKSKKEKIAGSISNIGKSLTDFVITTSQIAATTSASTSLLVAHASQGRVANKQLMSSTSANNNNNNNNKRTLDWVDQNNVNNSSSDINSTTTTTTNCPKSTSNNLSATATATATTTTTTTTTITSGDGNNNQHQTTPDQDEDKDVFFDEEFFEKERLFLALYHDSIRDAAIQADRVTQLQKAVADNYLQISQQLIKLAGIEVVPIISQTKDSSNYVSCPLPSLTMPTQPSITLRTSSSYSSTLSSPLNNNYTSSNLPTSSSSTSNGPIAGTSELSSSTTTANVDFQTSTTTNSNRNSEPGLLDDDDDDLDVDSNSGNNKRNEIKSRNQSDKSLINGASTSGGSKFKKGCANDHTSEGLKQLLLYVSDYLEQAKKIETRIASDEDLKLTDTFLYYKRDTVAAQNLLVRRLRCMSEYMTATKNAQKAKHSGTLTQKQYTEVIQKQAMENFKSMSKIGKQELADYKLRRVATFKKAFSDLVDLELKQLRAHSQLIKNCLYACNGLTDGFDTSKCGKSSKSSSSSGSAGSSGAVDIKSEPGTKLTSGSQPLDTPTGSSALPPTVGQQEGAK